MIAVVDYGASNVPSVLRGLRAVRADAMVTADPETVRRAPRVVVPGLGLLAGRVRRFATDLPVPHVGWAKVTLTARGRAHAALRGAFPGGDAFFYHVHSYHPDGVEPAADLADAEYGAPFATIVGRDAVLGVQFHPEKSQAAGLALLEGFAGWTP